MIHSLPIEIWNQIFSYLDNEIDLLMVSLVNKQFQTLLMTNNFWIYHIDDNYKYAKFNIYKSISEFANIYHIMYNFLDESYQPILNYVHGSDYYECNLSNIKNYNDLYITPKSIIKNFGFLYNFHDIYIGKTQQNDYCVVIDAQYDRPCCQEALLMYKRFLPDDHPDKCPPLIPNGGCSCYGKIEGWDFKIYGNYIWYVYEELNTNGVIVKFFAKNILTDKTYEIYTYNDEYDEIWKTEGHWKFNDNNTGLAIYKNI